MSQVARRSTDRTLSSDRPMATAVKTTVTELPESRVRVDAEVPPDELERSMQRTARQLGANMRIPGFRKGKVPPPVVIRRIGRERAARVETAERAAGEGDFVVMDYEGKVDGEPFEGGAGRDQMVELGSGRLIPGFEEQLLGASAGDERTVEVTFPAEYPAEHLAG